MELLRRYSNRHDLLEPLVEVLRRIEANDQTDEPGLDEPHRNGDNRRVLSDEEIAELVAAYLAGAAVQDLVVKYDRSLSSIKRILRANGARRYKRRGA